MTDQDDRSDRSLQLWMSWHDTAKNPEVPFAPDQTITVGSVPQPSSRSKTAPLKWSNGVWKSCYEVLKRLLEHCAEWKALTDTPEYLKCQSNTLHAHKVQVKTSHWRHEQRLLRVTFVTLFFWLNTLWGLKNEMKLFHWVWKVWMCSGTKIK